MRLLTARLLVRVQPPEPNTEKEVFDLWHRIEERGAVAIPTRSDALSRLEWAEVSELYPELVPDECRGYDIYSDERLISTCPFVRVGDAYKFKARTTGKDNGLDVFIDTRELVNMLCAKNYHIGLEDPLSAGVLTCSCGVSGCDGIDSQTMHVSERMVRWDVLRYRQRYELFFEREAYDVGVMYMLHDLCQEDNGIDYNVGGGYETRDFLIDGVTGMLARHPYYSDIWTECGFCAMEMLQH